VVHIDTFIMVSLYDKKKASKSYGSHNLHTN